MRADVADVRAIERLRLCDLRRQMPAARLSATGFGPLTGGKVGRILFWYGYEAAVAIPPDATRGSIVLPSLTINGQRFDAQTVTFARRKFVGVEAVNC